MQDFQKLQVWQKAHTFTLEIYRLTRSFPADERYGLTSQLRRAASSIGANIAEGCGRGSDTDFRRFIQIAMGSATESENHLLLCRDLQMIDPEICLRHTIQVQKVKRMLASLIKKLTADS